MGPLILSMYLISLTQSSAELTRNFIAVLLAMITSSQCASENGVLDFLTFMKFPIDIALLQYHGGICCKEKNAVVDDCVYIITNRDRCCDPQYHTIVGYEHCDSSFKNIEVHEHCDNPNPPEIPIRHKNKLTAVSIRLEGLKKPKAGQGSPTSTSPGGPSQQR